MKISPSPVAVRPLLFSLLSLLSLLFSPLLSPSLLFSPLCPPLIPLLRIPARHRSVKYRETTRRDNREPRRENRRTSALVNARDPHPEIRRIRFLLINLPAHTASSGLKVPACLPIIESPPSWSRSRSWGSCSFSRERLYGSLIRYFALSLIPCKLPVRCVLPVSYVKALTV